MKSGFGYWFVAVVCVGCVVATGADSDSQPVDDQQQSNDKYLNELFELEQAKINFFETFNDREAADSRWVRSTAKKDGADETIAKYDGEWQVEAVKKESAAGLARDAELDYGLVLKTNAKHAAIGAPFRKRFVFGAGEPLVVQYEVQFQNGMDCGGGYLKLLTFDDERDGAQSARLAAFNDKTPYSVMFGPDKCGNAINLHFIFRYRNPLNGSIDEKHCEKPIERFDEVFSDKLPHLLRLHLKPNSDFAVYLDGKEMISGSLLDKFSPAVNPPAEIDDPHDQKPTDWDERPKISDPNARKPDDWDETEPEFVVDETAVKPADWLDDEELLIADESAEKPNDWDESIDGDWEQPLIKNPKCIANENRCGQWEKPRLPNPKYKGVWTAPLIDNVNYKGKWSARKIPNPYYFEDRNPFANLFAIDAVGFELWSMSADILFDNIVVTTSHEVADLVKARTFDTKIRKIDQASKSFWGRFMKSIKYKLNWWIGYSIYLSIPISLFIGYLVKRALDPANLSISSLVDRIIELTNEYPLLWTVYTFITCIIVSVLAYFCLIRKSTSRSSSSDSKSDEAAVAAALVNQDVDDTVASESDTEATVRSRRSRSVQFSVDQAEKEEDANDDAADGKRNGSEDRLNGLKNGHNGNVTDEEEFEADCVNVDAKNVDVEVDRTNAGADATARKRKTKKSE